MNNSLRRIFALALAVVMLLGTAPAIALPVSRANAIGEDSSCGENLTWSFDEETGELTVDGFGAMTNYSPSSKAPWYDYRDSVQTIALPRGLKNIGDYAFDGCRALTSVLIDESKNSLRIIADNNIEECADFDGSYIQPYSKSENPDDIAETYFINATKGKPCTQKTRTIIIDVIKKGLESNGTLKININLTYRYEFVYLVSQTGGIGSETYKSEVYKKDITCPAILSGVSLHADGSPLSCYLKYYPQYGTEDMLAKDIITVNNSGDVPLKLLLVKQWQRIYNEQEDLYEEMDSTELDALEQGYRCEIRETHSSSYDIDANNEKTTYTNARINLTTYGTTNEEISGVSFKVFSGYKERTRTGLIRDGALVSLMGIGESAFKGCTSLENALYIGAESEWNAVKIANGNENLAAASVHFCESREHTIDFSTFSHYQEEHPHYAVYKCECGAERIGEETTELETCEFCNPSHACEFNTFSHYQEEHPHYAVYKCECGAEQIGEETTELEDCEICNPPHICDFKSFSHYQAEHPHYAVYKCECGAEQIGEETTEIDTCEICNPSHICEFNIFSHYQEEHPHYAVYKCECGAEQVSEETTKLDSCRICNPSIPREDAEIKRPSTSSIDYGDSIVLHFDADVELPAGAKIVWSVDNGNFSYSASADGKTCTITPKSSGETVFTAKVVDASGKTISEEYTQKMTSNAGFFQKLVAFFKKLFGATKIIAQAYLVKN